MSVYLYLIQGRKDPEQQMTGWGFNGPTLGLFAAIHVTYLSSLRCIRDDHSELELRFCQGMLAHVGAFNGDFEITSSPPLA